MGKCELYVASQMETLDEELRAHCEEVLTEYPTFEKMENHVANALDGALCKHVTRYERDMVVPEAMESVLEQVKDKFLAG